MKQFWRFLAVLIGPGAVLLLAFAGYATFDVYMLGNCDPKLGCFGRIEATAFITGLTLPFSCLGHVPACVVFRDTVRYLRIWWFAGVLFVLALGQWALFASSEKLLPGGPLIGAAGAWSAITAAFALAVFAVACRCSRDRSMQRTRFPRR